MKMGKRRAFSLCAFAAIVAIFACGLVFTGCKDGNDDVPVTGVTLDQTTLSLVGGENEILALTVLPANATNKNIIWSSSDTDVAIASEGIVYAIGGGTATITATTQDGRRTATCAVTVTGRIAVTGVELDKAIFLVIGRSLLLTPRFIPANTTNKNVTWTSYNPAVATVSNGTVTGVGSGNTSITAITADGYFEAACAVTVVTEIPEVDGMVWIYPGTFLMGSPYDEPESYENEIQHQVTLTEGFYMGIYPVTQAQYLELMGENPSYHPQMLSLKYSDRKDEFPVDSVSWFNALVYCNKRSLDEGLSPAYSIYKSSAPNANSATPAGPRNAWVDIPGNWSTDPKDWGTPPITFSASIRWNLVRMMPFASGYRLPTEAQWEYACRAGTTTPFNTGDNITTDQANWYGTNPYNSPYDPGGVFVGQPSPVGVYDSPNAWGLHDMHGNIEEWCWDRYGTYRGMELITVTDPTGPDSGDYRVMRGGSYWDAAKDLRSASRFPYTSVSAYNRLGFRVVRSYTGLE